MKKIVIVNQSSNYLMYDIARAYKDSSLYDDVVVMCGNPQSLQLEDQILIKVEKIISYNKKSIITRFWSWIIGTIQIACLVRKGYTGYELLLVSNPPTIHFLTYFCRNKYSALIYDVYPDGIVSGGFVTEIMWFTNYGQELLKCFINVQIISMPFLKVLPRKSVSIVCMIESKLFLYGLISK